MIEFTCVVKATVFLCVNECIYIIFFVAVVVVAAAAGPGVVVIVVVVVVVVVAYEILEIFYLF